MDPLRQLQTPGSIAQLLSDRDVRRLVEMNQQLVDLRLDKAVLAANLDALFGHFLGVLGIARSLPTHLPGSFGINYN